MEAAIEVAILVAVALPFLRLAVCRPFLRRLGSMPEQAVIGTVGLATYAVAIVAVASAAPDLLRAIAAAALVLAAAVWWRSRPAFGRGRGLPPGRLRVAPARAWTDQLYFARDAARYGPIFKTSTLLAPTVCVVGLPAAKELFAEHDADLAPPTNRFSRFIPRGFIRSMADDEHAKYAQLLRSAVSGAVTRSAETEIRQIFRESLATAGTSATPGSVAHPAVFAVFYRLFFGIGIGDQRSERLNELYPILDPMNAWRHSTRRVLRAVDEIVATVGQEFPDDCFVTAVHRKHPESLDDATLTRNLVYLTETAGTDVAALMTWVVWMLGKHPEWAHRAATAPTEERGQLCRRIVSETLRLEQSEYIMRRVSRSFTWRGMTFPSGARVRVCVWESHRDPQVFARPDEFDPDRWLNTSEVHEHVSPFGTSASLHRCLGEGVTLTLGRLFVEELVTGFEMSVATDGPAEYSGVHWRPSSRFRVGLASRTQTAPLTQGVRRLSGQIQA